MIVRKPAGPKPHVWTKDAAIDTSDVPTLSARIKKFLASGDLKDLPLKPGREPTVFMLAPLSRRTMVRTGKLSGAEASYERVACSLRDVRNYRLADGTLATLELVDFEGGRRVSEATLDQIYDWLLFVELDSRVVEISTVDPTYGQD